MYKTNIEEVANKVGGLFHLTVLIQKRLKGMKRDTRRGKSVMIDLICQEIMDGKIRLEPDKTEYEEDNTANVYQSFDDDDLMLGGKGGDGGFSIGMDEQ